MKVYVRSRDDLSLNILSLCDVNGDVDIPDEVPELLAMIHDNGGRVRVMAPGELSRTWTLVFESDYD